MNKIFIISNEWSDILTLENEYIYRNNHDDKGIIKKNDNNELIIVWDNWGEEYFVRSNNIYFKKNIKTFNIFIECTNFNDSCTIYPNSDISCNNYEYNGCIDFNNGCIEIFWYHSYKEKYFFSNYGRNLISDTLIKYNDNKNLKNIKNIAIVFPQYHEIHENNKFWGKGFTEWTLLKKTDKVIDNQNIKNPHSDIGNYNLKDYSHRKFMEKLSNLNNIYGFCYYHYWFKDMKVMYEPLELMIEENNPDKPFMFCWANEQWTRKWDGGNNDILIEQDYSNKEGNIKHFDYLVNFFKHKNYIKIENKPIFIFYRIEENDKNDIENIIKLWNELSLAHGFSGIYFMRFLGPFNNKIKVNGIQSFINFQPGHITQKYYNDIVDYSDNKIFENYNEEIYLNKNKDIKEFIDKRMVGNGLEHFKSIKGTKEENVRTSKFFVFDGEKSMNKIIEDKKEYDEQHLGIFTGWNNSPRRNYKDDKYSTYPHYYKNIDVELFGDTYKKLLHKINNNPNKKLDFLFISAWNEWNEQAILEPNDIDGYNYLDIINKKYSEFYNISSKKNVLFITHQGGGTEKYTKDLKKLFINYNFIYFSYDNYNKYDEIYNNIDLIHINSFLYTDLIYNYVNFFENNFKNIDKIITIHDYQLLYPHDPNIFSYNFNKNNINNDFINNIKYLFSICKKIIFPSYNILKNYNNVLKFDKDIVEKISVVYHPDILINNDSYFISKIDKIINIAFIGYFSDYKGSQLFKILINNNKYFQDKKIIYHIIGNLSEHENNNKIDNDNVIYHCEYKNNNLINLLYSNNIHGITHLSIFEESYCYTLSYSINSGIPIFYLNHGSLTERLNKNEKYFPSNLENIKENFKIFINYLNNNDNNKSNIKDISKLQINKWYINNY